MKYFITFELQPSGTFGVPEGNKTVIPSGLKSVVGDTFHRRTMTRVGYGTLPLFRHDKEAINLTFDLGTLKAHLRDNFITLEIESNSHSEAYNLAVTALDKFLQHLSLGLKTLFSFNPILFIDETDKIYLIPKTTSMATVTMYNLSCVSKEIERAANIFPISDALIEKALEYYEHALFLFDNSLKLVDVNSRHFRYLISSIFLNLWKAITTIIGDPSSDSDYQSRYRSLGFDYDFFVNKIKWIKNLRNNSDVAHHSTEKDKLNEIQANFGKAKEIAETVLIAYRDSLLEKQKVKEETFKV